MARVAIALLSPQDDPLLVRRAVAALAVRLEILGVGPLLDGKAAVLVKTEIGPLALMKLLHRASSEGVEMEIVRYGALAYRHEELRLPSPWLANFRSLTELEIAFG